MATKVLWFSRHQMSEAQIGELEKVYGPIELRQVSLTISSVKEIAADVEWADVLCIVAPLPLQKQFLDAAGSKPVLMAKTSRVLVRDPLLGANAEEKAVFVFEAWYRLVRIVVEMERLIPEAE